MSQIIKNGGGAGGSGIQTINGDIGSITGSTVTIFANNASNQSGATVLFDNSGTVSTLKLSDVLSNLSLGESAGPNSSNSSNSTAIGVAALASVTNSIEDTAVGYGAMASYTGGVSIIGGNTAIGEGVLNELIDGEQNIAIGQDAGGNYHGSESSNILIGNLGVLGESNKLRIGVSGSSAGLVNKAFIAGITGVTAIGSPMVVSSTGQLSDLGFGISTQVLTSNGPGISPTWQTGGSGGVSGPGSSTDRALATWNGTGGNALFNNSTTKIDSTGRMTNSAQPAFLAYNTNNQANVTGDGTIITITYDTVVFDQSSSFASNSFTAPVSGIYHFDASISFYNLSAVTNSSGCRMSFVVNSGEYKRFVQINAGLINDTTDSNTFIGSGSTLIKLNAADVVNITGEVGGSSKGVGLEGGQFTSFSGHLVC